MTSIQRIGVAVAAGAATLVFAGALVVDGYFNAQQVAAQSTSGLSQTPTLAPEIVYVRPAPSPEVIHVTQTAPASQPPVIHVVVPGPAGDDEEGLDD
jgi:hypothetical protein